jgi:quercetin dioxygenase-like cupin family protein
MMKVIRIEDVSANTPPGHSHLLSRRIIDASVGGKGAAISLVRMERCGRADPHIHDDAEQVFFVLRGEMIVKTDTEEVRLQQGQAALIYPGEIHENYNSAEGETDYLVVTSKLVP